MTKTEVKVCGLRFISATECFNDETGVEQLAFVIGYGSTIEAALNDAASTTFGDACSKQPLANYVSTMADDIRREWWPDGGYEPMIYIKYPDQPWQPLPE